MAYRVLCLLILSFKLGFSQFKSAGSYCIGAIGRDGIILAADSREVIFSTNDPKQSPICYFDSTQKVYLVNRFGLAFIGRSTVGNYYIRAIIKDYELSDFSTTNGDSVIFHFLRFCKKEFNNDTAYNSFTDSIKIMSIGYKNGRPYVCLYDKNSPAGYIKNPKSSLSPAPDDFRASYSDTLSCLELAKRAEKSIYDYAKDNDKEDIIGGNIIVLQIMSDNSHKWLLHSPKYTRKWITLNDFEKDYRNGKIKMTPAKGKTYQDIINLIGH